MAARKLHWTRQDDIPTHSFVCGHCSTSVASQKGWSGHDAANANMKCYAYVCHKCGRPNLIDTDGAQSPGPLHGEAIADVDEQTVSDIYDESRRAFAATAYTASVLCCRKLLMHIAVAKGAPANKSFAEYVEYLSAHHYVPPDAKDWVDHIRKKGNEATHEIVIMSKVEAEDLIAFSEMLLKLIYEFPAALKRRIGSPTKQ